MNSSVMWFIIKYLGQKKHDHLKGCKIYLNWEQTEGLYHSTKSNQSGFWGLPFQTHYFDPRNFKY